jgi:hypothetical protein
MDEPKSYTSQMTQELTTLNLSKTIAITRPKLPLKNVFERNFSAFFKVHFSSSKWVECMNYVIMIPNQLTESKSEVHKCQNNCKIFIVKQASLTMTFIKHESTQSLE